jgi:signal transduction histidine kinase/ABC-type uncharacterized transport system substrate-binding protein
MQRQDTLQVARTKIGRSARFIFSLIVATAYLWPQASFPQSIKPVRRVVILNELNTLSSPGYAEIDRAFYNRLQEAPYRIELYDESLEVTLFADPASQDRFREDFIRKYFDRKPDAIVAAGPASLKLIAELHERYFANIPVVFCGDVGDVLGELKPNPYITGVWGRPQPAKTIQAALRLLPKTEHLVVTGGIGDFDRGFEAITRDGLREYQSKLDITYLTDLPMSKLLERLKHLPRNTIVYHTAFTEDSTGEHFIDSTQAVPLVVNAANAPVFAMDDVDLGRGTVGGDLVNWSDDGRVAAEITLKVLGGVKPENVPIVASNNVYMFDWRALRRWGLNERDLPPGSKILYRELSLWERTKWIWISCLVVILCLSALVIYLLYSRTQLRLARDAQTHLSGLLINAQEQERSRLAAELHDDFSQRVALLTYELGDAADSLAESPDAAREKLNAVSDSVRELGEDLHTVSHRLHSSTLESLGLVAGLRALCHEFTTRQGIEIGFSSMDIPAAVNRDVALCLFRIAQEGLQNLKKHSGVTNAEVNLRRAGDGLSLRLTDKGRGFDVNGARDRNGLGLRSMEGRARIVGGSFEIQSEPGKGTRLEVWVPFEPTKE